MKKIWNMTMLVLMCMLVSSGIITPASAASMDSVGSEKGMYTYQGTSLQATSAGTFNGKVSDNGDSFMWLGVPYAKPPVGELRWRAPQSLQATVNDTYNTTALPQICTQLVNGKAAGSEDCLYMNIYRPATPDQNLPVLVFLHGGGNVTGSGGSFDGEKLAAQTDAIVVTVNYRLGLLGWMNSPAIRTGDAAEDSGNFALLDQIAALKWVQEHIGSFGGNANNVTLGGQSAGARDVLALTISPLAKGLFAKAMPLSGGMTTSTPMEGQVYAREKLADVLVKSGQSATREEALQYLTSTNAEEIQHTLRSLDSHLLVEAVGSVMIRMSEFPHLFADGTVVPTQGFDVVNSGSYNRVPMLVGSMQNEFNGFAAYDPVFMSSFTKNAWEPALEKQFWQATQYGSELYSSFNADQVAARYSQDPNAKNIYAYRFAWGTDVNDLKAPAKYVGATHGVDLDFLTNTFNKSAFAAMFKNQFYTPANEKGRIQLMKNYQNYVANFLHGRSISSGGLSPWKTWQQSGKLLKLNATAEAAHISMIKGNADVKAMKARIESSLTSQNKEIVWDKVLNGRFFFDPQY